MKSVIISALIGYLIIGDVQATESTEVGIQKIPSSKTITALNVYGGVTTLIPLALLIAKNLVVRADEDTLGLGNRRFEDQAIAFWTAMSVVATALTALIPFHFFMKAAKKKEKRQLLLAQRSPISKVKSVVSKFF